jgi:hypothetical protein
MTGRNKYPMEALCPHSVSAGFLKSKPQIQCSQSKILKYIGNEPFYMSRLAETTKIRIRSVRLLILELLDAEYKLCRFNI